MPSTIFCSAGRPFEGKSIVRQGIFARRRKETHFFTTKPGWHLLKPASKLTCWTKPVGIDFTASGAAKGAALTGLNLFANAHSERSTATAVGHPNMAYSDNRRGRCC